MVLIRSEWVLLNNPMVPMGHQWDIERVSEDYFDSSLFTEVTPLWLRSDSYRDEMSIRVRLWLQD
jgi:hypothetical protein